MQTTTAAERTELTDEEIVSLVLSGEKQLYEKIIRKYNPRLYRIGMTYVKRDAEMEDLMQNAYIKAYEHLGQFQNRSGFGTWLTRIFINECLQFLKKEKKTAFDSINELSMKNVASDHRAPDNVAMNKELAQVLEGALLELPEKYRLVFVMREMEDMSVAETVEALDLSESNVKVRLNRAKTMLRDKLNQYYKSEQVFSFYLTRCDRVVNNVMAAI
ncbi:RNA polymerase sigma factor [Polluticoccus soli]|uniref:RNA polymerase sigma factor n=1 Tax=Polluticoccus soli TaxID=3034150 RepID=UPI0023E2200B|nr:RNA polymerase sigma factor [Flavipsychrobacter sp. JY13-12]